MLINSFPIVSYAAPRSVYWTIYIENMLKLPYLVVCREQCGPEKHLPNKWWACSKNKRWNWSVPDNVKARLQIHHHNTADGGRFWIIQQDSNISISFSFTAAKFTHALCSIKDLRFLSMSHVYNYRSHSNKTSWIESCRGTEAPSHVEFYLILG